MSDRHDRADMLVADDAAPVDHEGLGHAGRAERHLHATVGVGADRPEGIAIGGEELRDVLRPVAAPRCRRSATPRRCSASSCGASIRQGMHQLAKMLTTCGWPRRSEALERPGPPCMPGGRSKSGTGWPISADWIGRCFSQAQRRTTVPTRKTERRRAAAQKHRPSHARASTGRARRSRRRRPIKASRPPSATIAPPSQIRVTNGFHQSLIWRRPFSSASPTLT